MSMTLRLFALVFSISLVGCAFGHKYEGISNRIPPLKEGEGRIFIYRDRIYQGSAIQPEIRLDGVKVGHSVPGGVFFVDRPGGNYVLECLEEKVVIAVSPGEERYVEFTVIPPLSGVGFLRVHPRLIDPEYGRQAIMNLSYIGTDSLDTDN